LDKLSYAEVLDYLYSQLPIFQRVGKAAYKADLGNTIALSKLLGYPENTFKSVHIAGTNGKGSTAHSIASVLQEAGYTVGLYTSPHLKDFRERIKVNGAYISKEYIVDFIAENKAAFDQIQPSFFEMTVALAFCYFRDFPVDIAIVETGLGGRLDSTNVVTPEVAVITNIDLDHTYLLGDTLAAIAAEKAGIIKKGVPVVVGEYHPETAFVFEDKANVLSAQLLWAEKEAPTPYSSDLKGLYQSKNMQTAFTALKLLQQQGWSIDAAAMKNGFANTVANTGLLGRWQTLGTHPLSICDVGHNPAGIQQVVKQLSGMEFNHLHWVLGMVNDKDIGEVLRLLPKEASYYFCAANIPRALSANELAEQAFANGLQGTIFPSVKAAYTEARSTANQDDLVFVGGSIFTVAEVV